MANLLKAISQLVKRWFLEVPESRPVAANRENISRKHLKSFIELVLEAEAKAERIQVFTVPVFQAYWTEPLHLPDLKQTEQWEKFEKHKLETQVLSWGEIGNFPEMNQHIASKLFDFQYRQLIAGPAGTVVLDWGANCHVMALAVYNAVVRAMLIHQEGYAKQHQLSGVMDFWFGHIVLSKKGDLVFHYLLMEKLDQLLEEIKTWKIPLNDSALEILKDFRGNWAAISPITYFLRLPPQDAELKSVRLAALFDGQCQELFPWLIRKLLNNFSLRDPSISLRAFSQIREFLQSPLKHLSWKSKEWNMIFFMVDFYHFFGLCLPAMQEIFGLTKDEVKTNRTFVERYEALLDMYLFLSDLDNTLKKGPRGPINNPGDLFRKKYRAMKSPLLQTETWNNYGLATIEDKLDVFREYILSITSFEPTTHGK
ncbi:MAG: hypothetical protein H6557_01645 [Lewinellaceae bacterium]|nr:hypothetical protein [Phaeodactylibacter sp.]MCB9035301.1 hypothetical protein [Lewinellaceae bacterium]